MYYGNTTLIPIPETSDKGKVVVAGSGYVYLQLGYQWDPDKRQPRYERKTIGKVDKKKTGMMYFSPEYERVFGVVDKEVEELKKKYGARELKLAGKFNYTLSYGPYACVHAACMKAGCLEPLQRAFPSQWRLILALCVHAIADEDMTSQAFPGWCFTNYCGMNRVVSDSEISQLYKSIGTNKGKIQIFFELYHRSYAERFPKSGRRAVGFDATNQNHGGKGIPLAELGHSKIDVGLPIINTAMFVDEETGIPFWYETYDGSLLDKTQNPFSMKKVVNLGFKKLFVVYDRGYYSEDGVEALEKLEEIEFGVLCSDGVSWVEELIREKGPELKDQQKYYVPDEKIYANVYEVQPFTESGNMKTYYAYLFYDSFRAAEERDTIHEVVDFYWKIAKKRKRYSEKMESDFYPKGIIVVKTEKNHETGVNFELYENTQMSQELLDMKGFFVMLSPTKLLASEAIRMVRKRDHSEKAFSIMMRHFKLRTTGRHKLATYEGMMFMAFIATICQASFLWFVKPFLNAVSSRTTATSFAELSKYQILWNNAEADWEPAYAMSKDQKEILECLDLTELDIQKQVEDIVMKGEEDLSTMT